jgi:hypothetical protein
MLKFPSSELLQILSMGVSGGGETAIGRGVVSSIRGWGEEGGGRQYTGRENLEQFPTTES